jgi:hypothetical protein
MCATRMHEQRGLQRTRFLQPQGQMPASNQLQRAVRLSRSRMAAADQVRRTFHMRGGTMWLPLRSRRGIEGRRRSVTQCATATAERGDGHWWHRAPNCALPHASRSSRFQLPQPLPAPQFYARSTRAARMANACRWRKRTVSGAVLFFAAGRSANKRTDIALTESLSSCVNVAASCAAVTCLTGSQCVKGQCVPHDDPSYQSESQPGGQQNMRQRTHCAADQTW